MIDEKEEETPLKEKILIKYFETNNPDLVLSFDGTNFVLEKKKKEEEAK